MNSNDIINIFVAAISASTVVFIIHTFYTDILSSQLKNWLLSKQYIFLIKKTTRAGLHLSSIKSLNRPYMLKVYPELTKITKSKKLSYIEAIRVLRKLEKIAQANSIPVSYLCETIETLDGNGSININQIAFLLGKGIDMVTVVSKARRGYSFQQIIDSNGLPVDWSDGLYLNK